MLVSKFLRRRRPVVDVLRRLYSDDGSKKPPPMEHPAKRTVRVMKNDVKKFVNHLTGLNMPYQNYMSDRAYYDNFPRHADIVIVGGGIMGLATAYFLKARGGSGVDVAVIEKDPTYKAASTVLSVGGLRQQFSLPENILMSQYAAEFFKDIHDILGSDIDLRFTPYGYLVLASENSASQLEENQKLQKKLKVKNILLDKNGLKKKFPWINTDGIELGCLGLENEGWFDPWALLYAFKRKIISMGVRYLEAEVVDFSLRHQPDIHVVGVPMGKYQQLHSVIVKRKEGDYSEIEFANVILTAGAASGKLAELAGIGKGEGLLNFPLPVEPRKRFVYCFSCPDEKAPGINTPLTIDPTGTYFRREGAGNMYIAGKAPEADCEPSCENLDVDHDFFESDVWPHLAQRVPAFAGVKVNSSWAGFYEFNTYDENGIIGVHPYHVNLYMATGFSGHGIQQGPAVGRAIAELIFDGGYQTIDLKRLGFDRILMDLPMYETNIY